MERTEGRWPSLDPTKNNLRMEQRAISTGPIPKYGEILGVERDVCQPH